MKWMSAPAAAMSEAPLFTVERPGELDDDGGILPEAEPLFDSAAAAPETDEDAYLSDEELFDADEVPPAKRPRFGPSDFEEPQRSRASLLAIAAVLAVAIIGGGVAATIGLTSGSSDAEP